MSLDDCIQQRSSKNNLVKLNQVHIRNFLNNPLMRLIMDNDFSRPMMRERLLAALQTFSNYFQKVVLLRHALNDSPIFQKITMQHLTEEYAHDQMLAKDRQHKPPLWEPILESSASWFCWKMFTLDNLEKHILVHMVLEVSADLFFSKANQVMSTYQETNYFDMHSNLDAHHAILGEHLLHEMTAQQFMQYKELLNQGWAILNVACSQIAILTVADQNKERL